MKNPTPEKGGYFFSVIGTTWAGAGQQWTCAVCGGPAIGATFGAIKCTNSPDNCPQGDRLYALPAAYLEPYDPKKHGRGQ